MRCCQKGRANRNVFVLLPGTHKSIFWESIAKRANIITLYCDSGVCLLSFSTLQKSKNYTHERKYQIFVWKRNGVSSNILLLRNGFEMKNAKEISFQSIVDVVAYSAYVNIIFVVYFQFPKRKRYFPQQNQQQHNIPRTIFIYMNK